MRWPAEPLDPPLPLRAVMLRLDRLAVDLRMLERAPELGDEGRPLEDPQAVLAARRKLLEGWDAGNPNDPIRATVEDLERLREWWWGRGRAKP